jgi:hypothetical protein
LEVDIFVMLETPYLFGLPEIHREISSSDLSIKVHKDLSANQPDIFFDSDGVHSCQDESR